MQIDVLVCEADGTQRVERRDVSQEYLAPGPETEPATDYGAFLAGLMEGYVDD